jgi:hypothetical protein
MMTTKNKLKNIMETINLKNKENKETNKIFVWKDNVKEPCFDVIGEGTFEGSTFPTHTLGLGGTSKDDCDYYINGAQLDKSGKWLTWTKKYTKGKIYRDKDNNLIERIIGETKLYNVSTKTGFNEETKKFIYTRDKMTADEIEVFLKANWIKNIDFRAPKKQVNELPDEQTTE